MFCGGFFSIDLIYSCVTDWYLAVNL